MKLRFLTLLLLSFSLFSFAAEEDQGVLDALKNLKEHPAEDSQRVILLNDLAKQYRRNDPKKAIQANNQAAALAEKIGYTRGRINAFTAIGVVLKDQGLPDSALVFHFKALELCGNVPEHEKAKARVLNNIGIAYKEKLDFNKAVKYYTEAIVINEKYNDLEGLGMCNNNIGIIYKRQDQLDKALLYFQKASEIHLKNKDKKSAAKVNNNIASILIRQKKYSEALKILNEGEKALLEVNDFNGLAVLYGHITSVYREQGNYEKAEEYCVRAGSYCEKLGDKDGAAGNHLELADLFIRQKKYSDAIYHIEQGLKTAEEIKDIEIIKDAWYYFGKAYDGMGEYKKAYDSHVKMSAWGDSIAKLADNEQLNELQAQFDSDRKEREITVLKQQEQLDAADRNKQKLINIGLSVGLVLVFALLFVVFRSYRLNKRTSIALSEKNAEIEEKNKDITDSIHYAKRLQQAILPDEEQVRSLLPDSFVFYRSKDIVSGDIYWVDKTASKTFFAVIDCTGHGVPGAFMSIMAYNLIKQSLAESKLETPSLILDDVNKNLRAMLRKQSGSVNDGMDVAICAYDRFNRTVEYAGAYNPLWLVKAGAVTEYKPDKFSIGLSSEEGMKFTNHVISVDKGDSIYIFSDGYADQFGGERGKKLMKKNFRAFLNEIHALPMDKQKVLLMEKHDAWKGEHEQLDDICVIGMRI